jgi:hypothetical protein
MQQQRVAIARRHRGFGQGYGARQCLHRQRRLDSLPCPPGHRIS